MGKPDPLICTLQYCRTQPQQLWEKMGTFFCFVFCYGKCFVFRNNNNNNFWKGFTDKIYVNFIRKRNNWYVSLFKQHVLFGSNWLLNKFLNFTSYTALWEIVYVETIVPIDQKKFHHLSFVILFHVKETPCFLFLNFVTCILSIHCGFNLIFHGYLISSLNTHIHP